METENLFFESNLKPFAEEIENVALILNSLGEEKDEGMRCFLTDTLTRIAQEIKGKIAGWEKEFVVYRKN